MWHYRLFVTKELHKFCVLKTLPMWKTSASELFVRFDILIIARCNILDALFFYDDNAVCDRLDKLVVMRSEEHDPLERAESVVYGGDRLEVEVVRRLIENEDI